MRSSFLALALVSLTGCEPETEIDNEIVVLNEAPVALAGNDIAQTADKAVSLDGSGSYDPDGHRIHFHWEFDRVPEGSVVAEREQDFVGNHTEQSKTSFTPDLAGIYIVKLTVEDEKGLFSAPDFVVVSIEEGNLPVANAGVDQEGTEGETFNLTGAASYDPTGRDLTYSWELGAVPEGSSASLTGSDSATPSFTADKGGMYIAALTVDNGISSSVPDTVIVRVSSADPQPPTAAAGDDVEVEDCTWVDLDGSGSYDPNGDDMEYLWSVQQVPEDSNVDDDSIEDRQAETTRVWVDAAGDYSVTLSVSDGESWSRPDILAIAATERSFNTAPVVDAGSNQSVDGGEAECEEDGYTYDCDSCSDSTVELGGDAAGTDADGDPISYFWEVVSGDATISDPTSLVTTVKLEDAEPTEPNECEDTEYVFQLTGTDCVGAEHTDTVTFTVTCCGVEPADSGSK